MQYIESLNEFAERINESKSKIDKPVKTGNEVSHMLGKNEKVGREIFNVINDNVEKLESLIENYNKEHAVDLKKSPLEVKIDKTKLDIKYLISLTKLSKVPFIADVIVSNILNYKILIRPIKNARIIALAYRYYLAMVRHALQTSLIMIELSADTFFSQINANLTGRRKQMKELIDNAIMSTKENMLQVMQGQSFVDDKGRVVNLEKVLSKNQMKDMIQLIKSMNAMNNSRNEFDRLNGYNQNVFQDSGRTIESMLKTNQDKELQSLSEQFTNIANSTTGLAKDDKADAREHVANYAAAVKLSTERRAMEICEQINLNMFEIIKMFSIRNIDGYSEAFESSSELDKKLETIDKKMEEIEKEKSSIQSEIESRTKKAIDELTEKLNDEEKEKMLEHWKDKGIDTLCSPKEFRELVYENKDIRKLLKTAGFNDNQIYNIVDRTEKVNEYGKIYYGEVIDYIKKKDYFTMNGKNYDLDDVEGKDEDDLFCWMRTDSVKYKELKGLNTTSSEEKEKKNKKH